MPVDDLRGVSVLLAPLDQRGQVGHAPPRGGQVMKERNAERWRFQVRAAASPTLR
ncbi:hypothetical protein [Nonomuraea sp. SYSU D8015]|uniref:hypothetical protein n=1 Tax=Nonomuraea sp. SYSU D8015 TaxID=2593644 RepID=UPI001CB6D8CC|nr:hypothetical protein [Nonomuraea sp. SYSU D8015]